MTKDEWKFTGFVCITKNLGLPNEEFKGCYKNVIMNVGKNNSIRGLFLATMNPAKYITVGNGSEPQATDTNTTSEIGDCGFGRQDVSANTVWNGIGNVSQWYTYTWSCDGVLVNSTWMINGTSGSDTNPVCGTTFSDTTGNSGDTLTVNYTKFQT